MTNTQYSLYDSLMAAYVDDNDDHRVISVGGWTCDVCGQEVNGQTDGDGIPKMDGESVRHV